MPAELNPTIEKLIDTGHAQLHNIWISDTQLAAARTRDSALYDLKVIQAVTAKELLVSDFAGEVARGNLAEASPATAERFGAPGATASPVAAMPK